MKATNKHVNKQAYVLGAELILYPRIDHRCLSCGSKISGGGTPYQIAKGMKKPGRTHFRYVVSADGRITTYRLCPDCVIKAIEQDGLFRSCLNHLKSRDLPERHQQALDEIMRRLNSGESGFQLLREWVAL